MNVRATLLFCLSLLIGLGCRPPASREQAEAAPDQKVQAVATDSPSILGTWEVVAAHFDGREHPELTGVRWTFDGQEFHELYGDDIAHAPHGPRAYSLDLDCDPPQIHLESYGGCIININPSQLQLDADTLQLTDFGVQLTMLRLSEQPRVPTQNSFEMAKERMETTGDDSEIDGLWRRKLLRFQGRELSPDMPSAVRYRKGRMIYVVNGQEQDRRDGVEISLPRVYFDVDPSTSPKQINQLIDSTDGTSGGWQHAVGIYKLEDEQLHILTVIRGKRPTSFTECITDFAMLTVYERVMDADAPPPP